MVRTLRRFLPHLRGYRPALVVGAILVLVVAGADVLAPWPLKLIVDNVLKGEALRGPFAQVLPAGVRDNRDNLLAVAAIGLLAIVAVGAFADYLGTVLLDGVGERLTADLRERIFAHLQRLSLSYHDRQRAGDLTTRIIADVDYVQEMLVASLSVLIPNLAVLLGIVIVMFAVDPEFAALSLAMAPLLFLTVFRYTRRIKSASRTARGKESEVASIVSESLSSIRVVQAYTLEPMHLGLFKERNNERMSAGLDAIQNQAKLSPVVDMIAAAGTVVVLWFGAHRVLAGEMSLGLLLVFQAYLAQLYKPMRNLSKLASVLSRGQASAERVDEVLQTTEIVEEKPDAVAAPPLRGAVTLQRVTFGYERDRPVLHDVSLDIKAGEMIAVVGATGAGKSTIAGLIPRLYDPWKGRILVDGKDLRSFTLRSLRSQVALVLQDSILYHGSILENISYGTESASFDQVMAAAEVAYVDEFVRDMPEGYETVVSERGVTLSGGQRQRIAIARALVRDTPIVILDEPTSNLDAVSERYVMKALENLTRGRTVIVIAHRLSTLRGADRIYVVEAGHLVDNGTHEELMERDGPYRAMYLAQARDHEPLRPVLDLSEAKRARRPS
jgi:subfamily B ATP-binding cassette protein MsbA